MTRPPARPWRRAAGPLSVLVVLALGSSPCRAMFYTTDALQIFSPPRDNFEVVLGGDQGRNLTGLYLNSFPPPNSVKVIPGAGTTTVEFDGPGLPQDPATFRTFGFELRSEQFVGGRFFAGVDVRDKFWTRSQDPTDLPAPGVRIEYDPTTLLATLTYDNDPNTFSLFSVGYLISPTPFALSDLNRTTLPPSAFLPSGVPDGTTLNPSDSVSYSIPGVPFGSYIVAFADARFTGPSAGLPYTELSGTWAQFHVPEPGSLALVGTGLALIAATHSARRRRLVRRLGLVGDVQLLDPSVEPGA